MQAGPGARATPHGANPHSRAKGKAKAGTRPVLSLQASDGRHEGHLEETYPLQRPLTPTDDEGAADGTDERSRLLGGAAADHDTCEARQVAYVYGSGGHPPPSKECRHCLPPAAAGPGGVGKGVLASFLAMGAGTVVTWDATYVSEVYFGHLVGNQVLANLGLAQNCSALAAMSACMWLRYTRGVQAYAATIGAAYCVMLAYAAAIVAVVGTGARLPPPALYGLVVCNGLATGVAQAQLGSLSGLFTGGRADAIARIGSALGAVLPAIVQVAMVFSGMHVRDMHEVLHRAELQLMTVFGVAAAGLACALVGLRTVGTSACFREQLRLEASELADDRANAVAEKALARRTLGISKYFAASAFATYAVSLFLLSAAPMVPAVPLAAPGVFWSTQLTTVLIAVYTLGDLLGRLVAKQVGKRCLCVCVRDTGD